MGKVKNDAPAVKATKTAPKGPSKGSKNRFAPFVTNLFRTSLYKPTQGWNARLYTGIGLGVIVALGVWRLFEILKDRLLDPLPRYGVPVMIGAVSAWFLIRTLHYPPFADFLIATEAEMNKVSWTSRADLYRATTVVLATVVLTTVYLFGVDWVWSSLLQLIGVLKFDAGGGMGQNG